MEDRELYSFQITYFDEVDRYEKTKSGFVFGSNLKDVINSFDNYWGQENIKDMRLCYIGACTNDMMIVPDRLLHTSFIEELKKENYW